MLTTKFAPPPPVLLFWFTDGFFVPSDFVNPSTGAFDPRHLFGVMNQDVYRASWNGGEVEACALNFPLAGWPSLTNGTRKNLLGTFITTLMLPGIPLTYYGEEQGMYIYDSQGTLPSFCSRLGDSG